MEGKEIIRLLWNRDETAVERLEQAYGNYCYGISWQIVQNHEDASECLNDTWLKTWFSIPDKRPDSLRAYVAKIVRNLSLNRVIHERAQKRGNGAVQAVWDDVEEMFCRSNPIDEMIDRQTFIQKLNGFLDTLSRKERAVFVLRFWYFQTPKDIAERFGVKEKVIYNMLYRLKNRFASYWRQIQEE